MRRVVSLYLPNWPTDRLRRAGLDRPRCLAESPDAASLATAPRATVLTQGRRRVLGGVCKLAAAQGLQPGMTVANARMLCPNLVILNADVAGDEAGLRLLAGWALRYGPLAAPDSPNGVLLDITGCTHLHGGEAVMLDDIRTHLSRAGYSSRIAAADTPAAARALARHGLQDITVMPPGATECHLSELPVTCLRLPEEVVAALHRMGLDLIRDLLRMARASLARRYGEIVVQRLDQLSGTVFEPILPVLPPAPVAPRLTFLEPLLTAEAFVAVINDLTRLACEALERAGEGARRLDLLFERTDGAWQAIRIGTARPARSARHLARLLSEKLDTVDPGFGVEAMQLVVGRSERLDYTQTVALREAAGASETAELIDRLTARLGADAVYRLVPVQSAIPERSVRRVPALHPAVPQGWPSSLPRPVRLFNPPRPIEVMALMPDQPPVQFIWQRVRRRVRRADGPERIIGEWWHSPAELLHVRDYFRVEDVEGQRWWLFRRGDGVDLASGDLAWFLHGLG